MAPGGRLIVSGSGSARRPEARAERVGDRLRAWGYPNSLELAAADLNGVIITHVACIDRAAVDQ